MLRDIIGRHKNDPFNSTKHQSNEVKKEQTNESSQDIHCKYLDLHKMLKLNILKVQSLMSQPQASMAYFDLRLNQ